jgi:hypothetical protein
MGKDEWEEAIYGSNGYDLKAGNEDWCGTCHDDSSGTGDGPCEIPVGSGVFAPNVMGDNVAYSYSSSGHGRPDINVQCADCHTLSSTHTDGIQRTYEAAQKNYVGGYRLRYGMDIPRYGTYGAGAFELCFDCHSYADVLGPESNFRDDDKSWQFHELHLQERFAIFDCWDSDWDGEVDSAISCTACHNVHGSPMKIKATYFPNPVMIRHGELISSPEMDRVPALDFRWYESDARSPVFSVPVVHELIPCCTDPGHVVRMIGSGFGHTQGDSVLHVGQKIFDSTSSRIKFWSETKIRFRLPFLKKPCSWFKQSDGTYRKREVWVTVGGVDSNVKRIKVFKPDTCP